MFTNNPFAELALSLPAAAMQYFVILMILLSQNMDFLSAFSAVGATLNNLGPGLGEVANNYKSLTDISIIALCLSMLLGRLEIFTLLLLFTPSFWRN